MLKRVGLMMLAAILGLVVLMPLKAAAFDDDDYYVIRRHSFIEEERPIVRERIVKHIYTAPERRVVERTFVEPDGDVVVQRRVVRRVPGFLEPVPPPVSARVDVFDPLFW